MPGLTVPPRPVLHSCRVVAFSGANRGDATGARMRVNLKQVIDIGLAVPTVPEAPIMVYVQIGLEAQATNEQNAADVATFAGEYEAKFGYAPGVAEEAVAPLLNDDLDYQYVLVAQAFPLAMTHFRRELQAMGLDARGFPLGLTPHVHEAEG